MAKIAKTATAMIAAVSHPRTLAALASTSSPIFPNYVRARLKRDDVRRDVADPYPMTNQATVTETLTGAVR